MAASPQPTSIEPIGDELAVVWSDGSETYYKLEALRRACPCAACGGEPDVMGHVLRPQVTYVAQSFVLRSVRIVGGYAVQPVWNDGHDSGLYTFKYLRNLAESAK